MSRVPPTPPGRGVDQAAQPGPGRVRVGDLQRDDRRRGRPVGPGGRVAGDGQPVAQPRLHVGRVVDVAPPGVLGDGLEQHLAHVAVERDVVAQRGELPQEPEAVDLLPGRRVEVDLDERERAGGQRVLGLARHRRRASRPPSRPRRPGEDQHAARGDERPGCASARPVVLGTGRQDVSGAVRPEGRVVALVGAAHVGWPPGRRCRRRCAGVLTCRNGIGAHPGRA